MPSPVPTKAYPHPMQPAMYREQRQRLGKSLKAAFPDGRHAALLQAGSEVPVNSSDINYLFVQEPYFQYLYGCEMPDCYGLVLADGSGVLFIPRLPEDYATWMGTLPTPERTKSDTEVDECYYIEEMDRVLQEKGVTVVELLCGLNSDSGLPALSAKLPSGVSAATPSTSHWLFQTLSNQRAFKTPLEAEVLKYVCKVSSDAHITVMQTCKPGMSQGQLEATFLREVYYKGGCRKVSYTCICATGCHGATLHYPNNDQPVEDGTMALLDMGGNYRGYAADITCSFPVNGRFTEKQKVVYNAVLHAHDAVLKAMKPGVSWVAMHTLAIQTICEHLLKAGVFHGTTAEALMKKEVMQYFQPHGLGHLIGLEVHDVGAYLDHTPPRPTAKDACKLRTARTLEEGLYMTVEPGCYFNSALIDKALKDPNVKDYINKEVLMSFADFGGVRIESDVLVTKDGIINYTCVPRTVDEIEAVMAGKPFSKEVEEFKNA